jgi:hypothetical protein
VRAVGRRFARAGNSGLRVDDDRPLQQSGRGERLEREQRRRGIAARTRDETSPPDRVAMPLGDAVDHAFRERRGRGIELLARGGVAQSKRARQVDHAHAAGDERRAGVGRRRLGKRQERDRRLAGDPIQVERDDRVVPDARERRQRARGARRAGRHRHRQRGRRMPGEQAHQLLAGIAGGAGDGDGGGGRARDRHRSGHGVKEYLYEHLHTQVKLGVYFSGAVMHNYEVT